MTSISDQLSAVRKSQWETQLDLLQTFGSRALASAEQLMSLNLRASRTTVEQATGTFKQLLDATNPRDIIAVGSRAQGQWHYLFEYGRELLGIASGLPVQTWSTQPSSSQVLPTPLQLASSANVPTSFAQVMEQASIAAADVTTVTSEIAAAAADTGAALAEAGLHASAQAVARAEPAAQAEASMQAEASIDAAIESAIESAIADQTPSAKAKPLAEALNEVAPKPASAEHPIASTLPLQSPDQIELPAVAPVDAKPPVHVAVPPAPPTLSSKAPRASRGRK